MTTGMIINDNKSKTQKITPLHYPRGPTNDPAAWAHSHVYYATNQNCFFLVNVMRCHVLCSIPSAPVFFLLENNPPQTPVSDFFAAQHEAKKSNWPMRRRDG